MRIAILIDDITGKYGVCRAVYNLFTILEKSGIVVHLISRESTSEDSLGFFDSSTVVVHHGELRNTSKSLFGRIIANIKFFFSLRKLIKKEKIDVVVSTRCTQNCFLPFYAPNCKRVACEHGNYMCMSRVRRIFRRIMYPFLDAVVLLTHRDAERYTFISKNKRFVVPNSLSFTCDQPSNCEAKRILLLGRYNEQKGYDYFLRVAVLLKKAIPDWHVDIFGSGEDEEMLKSMARELNVDDFVSLNPPTTDSAKELSTSSIYAMSSRYEGLPMVLLEAQVCGLPIVSFDCPEGPSEVIHDGEDGFLVPLGDEKMLADRIITLAKDEAMRKRFGRAAQVNCQRFSSESVGAMWMQLIEAITKK